MDERRSKGSSVTLAGGDLERILAISIEDRNDWFGLASATTSLRRTCDQRACSEAAMAHLGAVLTGRTPQHDGNIRMIIEIGAIIEVDATTARLMAVGGIRPSAAAALASLNLGQLMLSVDTELAHVVRLATGRKPADTGYGPATGMTAPKPEEGLGWSPGLAA